MCCSYVQGFNPADPRTHQGRNLRNMSMAALYKDFGLDAQTVDFIGCVDRLWCLGCGSAHLRNMSVAAMWKGFGLECQTGRLYCADSLSECDCGLRACPQDINPRVECACPFGRSD